MSNHHSPRSPKTMPVVFFMVVGLFAIVMIILAMQPMRNTDGGDNNQLPVNQAQNTNAAGQNNTNIDVSSNLQFNEKYGWDIPFVHNLEVKTISEGSITTYQFQGQNALIIMPEEYASMITEGYGTVSSQKVSVDGIMVDRVVGASARDGSAMHYVLIPFENSVDLPFVLLARGSADFVDSVLETFTFY